MPEQKIDFENDIAIDLDDLHEEWRTHAQTRKKYADEVSYLEKKKQKAWELTKVTRSRLIREAKELKLSSADLREAYFRENEEYQKAKEDQIDIEYNLSMAWNALNAFDNRKDALENEVKLWTRSYFAAPTEERMVQGGKRIEDTVIDKTSQKIRGEANQTRKRKRK